MMTNQTQVTSMNNIPINDNINNLLITTNTHDNISHEIVRWVMKIGVDRAYWYSAFFIIH